MSKTRQVAILSVGKYILPQDARFPYYATLDLRGDGVGQQIPMEQKEFFKLVNSLVVPRTESCGQLHVSTVTVPDDGTQGEVH